MFEAYYYDGDCSVNNRFMGGDGSLNSNSKQ